MTDNRIERIPIGIICRCGEAYTAPDHDGPEAKRLAAAVREGIMTGNWSGLTCPAHKYQ